MGVLQPHQKRLGPRVLRPQNRRRKEPPQRAASPLRRGCPRRQPQPGPRTRRLPRRSTEGVSCRVLRCRAGTGGQPVGNLRGHPQLRQRPSNVLFTVPGGCAGHWRSPAQSGHRRSGANALRTASRPATWPARSTTMRSSAGAATGCSQEARRRHQSVSAFTTPARMYPSGLRRPIRGHRRYARQHGLQDGLGPPAVTREQVGGMQQPWVVRRDERGEHVLDGLAPARPGPPRGGRRRRSNGAAVRGRCPERWSTTHSRRRVSRVSDSFHSPKTTQRAQKRSPLPAGGAGFAQKPSLRSWRGSRCQSFAILTCRSRNTFVPSSASICRRESVPTWRSRSPPLPIMIPFWLCRST
jgi:hypothetical protein